jgi:hypothetical protein
MSGKKSILASMTVAFLIFAGIALFYRGDLSDLERWVSQISDRFKKPSDGPAERLPDQGSLESQGVANPPILRPVPKPEHEPGEQAFVLPPSPPLPEVPPESSQGERKQAFGLENSVDHIILKDEPFDIAGKKYTIGGIQSAIQGSKAPSQTAEGSPRTGSEAPYYGVRIVKPSENVWKIHYGILREYLARRQFILPPNADRPLPGGRSTGVSRLLKFIESVVVVYDAGENKVEKNINLIQPYSFIIFFKISDLFKALDQMQPVDWKWLRYVRGSIRLNRPGASVDLIDKRSLE